MNTHRGWLALALLCACGSTGGGGPGGGTLGITDGGIQPLPGETCGASVSCGQKTYKLCMAGSGAQCQSRYLTSDGQAFTCNSCSECSVGASQVATWCNGASGGGADMAMADDTRCRTSTDCIGCCEANHPSGATAYQNRPRTCLCTSPGPCSFDCSLGDWCDGQEASTFCQSCMQAEISSGGSCVSAVSSCSSTSPDCSALVTCIKACR